MTTQTTKPEHKGYDEACENLAKHFLGSNPQTGALQDLSQTIQDAIEDWFLVFGPQPPKDGI